MEYLYIIPIVLLISIFLRNVAPGLYDIYLDYRPVKEDECLECGELCPVDELEDTEGLCSGCYEVFNEPVTIFHPMI